MKIRDQIRFSEDWKSGKIYKEMRWSGGKVKMKGGEMKRKRKRVIYYG